MSDSDTAGTTSSGQDGGHRRLRMRILCPRCHQLTDFRHEFDTGEFCCLNCCPTCNPTGGPIPRTQADRLDEEAVHPPKASAVASRKTKYLVMGAVCLCLAVGLFLGHRSGLFVSAPSERHIRQAIAAYIMATVPLVQGRWGIAQPGIYSEFFTDHLEILKVGGYDRTRQSWVVKARVHLGAEVVFGGGDAQYLGSVVAMLKLDEPTDYVVYQDANGGLEVRPEESQASEKRSQPSEPRREGSRAGATAPLAGLCEAIKAADVAKVRGLLEKGADTGERDSESMTPLCLAAREGNDAVVELLLARGAELTVGCKDGFTALEFAAWKGRTRVVNRLLQKGADVNARDRLGASSLWLAASAGHLEVVKALLAKGAELNITDNGGFTPLHEAAGGAHTRVAALLVSKGADVNARTRNQEGWTPLHYAVVKGNRETAALLLAKGADPTAKDKDGNTPADVARKLGREELLPLLSGRTGRHR